MKLLELIVKYKVKLIIFLVALALVAIVASVIISGTRNNLVVTTAEKVIEQELNLPSGIIDSTLDKLCDESPVVEASK